jgi:hypothetical protein
MDSDAQTLVNGTPVSGVHALAEGDEIQIGKHALFFSAEGEGVSTRTTVTRLPSAAWLQIHTGSHLGRTIRLDKAFTRIGRPDGNLAVIAHREDGYFLSHLQGDTTPQVNEQDIGERTTRLNDNDFISVGELKVQFFADAGTEPAAPAPDAPDRQQRRFSRIPFEVPVTLRLREQSWPAELVDISLHGALIRTPGDFQAALDSRYQLSIHLEGGPDIAMEATIAHQRNDELGLRCVDIDLDSVTHLRRLVELNLGEPELLEREISALG